jgi:Fe-S-cluster formation regulator IscX/YfhJ
MFFSILNALEKPGLYNFTDIHSIVQQLINNFKDIIQTATNDITAMNTKRSIHARQECLDVTDIERCIQDLGEIVDDPSEILGSKRFVKVGHNSHTFQD